MAFKRAEKRDARLRFGLLGPAGSGKTRTALELASRIGKRVAVIDSERGRSRAYCGLFEFDVEDSLPDFSPDSYVKAIKAAETAGYDVIVVDSASHEWAGKGGVLGMVDAAAAKSQSGNKFTAWAVGTPAHQSFIDAVLQCRCHVIITLRSKTEWVLEENAQGKKVPKAVGVGAVARDGTEYEVDFVGLLDQDHVMTMIKTTNYAELEGMRFVKPGADLAGLMLQWLARDTVPAPAPVVPAVIPPPQANGKPESGLAAAGFAKAIAEAASLDALQTIAPLVGAAHKAGHITTEERKALVLAFIARQAILAEPKAEQQGATA